ncbi:MAG: TraB/GumN family protein [Steroidobacteraceae bacterium]
MRMRLAAGIAALALLPCLAPAAELSENLDELETVLVIGEQPGPGLWKVSKGDHVMWVLASFSPLPKAMTWRSKQVEARIAESQEVLYPGTVGIELGIGLLRGLTLVPAAFKAGKIPDGAKLKDVLPADTYTKWLALRQKYIGKDDAVEKRRPAIALGALRGAAYSKSNLAGGPSVDAVVTRAAKKYKVRIHRLPDVKRAVKVEDPRAMLKSAQKLKLPDIDCFTRGLDLVEAGIERARLLANAWSRGDIETLRSLHRVVPLKETCAYVLMTAFNEGNSDDAARAKKLLANIEWHVQQASIQADLDWIAAARAALDKNQSTFGVLSVDSVLRPDGLLDQLRAQGYTVEEPL